MELRYFGTTELEVSPIGYGAGNIGSESISEKKVENILNSVLDMGINLIDTAKGYGLSEERIGKYIAHRRQEYILSTKVGYGIPGFTDWTYDIIIKGVEEALQKLKTDYIDIVHLHSCSKEILKKDDVIRALEYVQEKGLVRYIAYSGENENLDYAINSNRFQSIMASVNICDQNTIYKYLPLAKEKGMGFVAKRPVANIAWQFTEQPHGEYAEEYWLRLQKMKLPFSLTCEIAIRFSAYTYGVDTCIVGSTNVEHIKNNIKYVEKGKLPEETINKLQHNFLANDQNWQGQV